MDAIATTVGFLAIWGFLLLMAFEHKMLAFIVGILLTNIAGIVFAAVAFKFDLSAQVTALFLCGLLIANLAVLFKKEVGIFWTVPINWVQFSQTGSKIDVLGSGQIMTLPQATLNTDDMRSLGLRPFRLSFEIERENDLFIAVISGSYKPGSDSGEQEAALVRYFQLGTEQAAYAAIGVDLARTLKPWIQSRIEGVAQRAVRSEVQALNEELKREDELIDALEERNGIDVQVSLEDLALPGDFQEVRELRARLKTVIDLSFGVHDDYQARVAAMRAEDRANALPFDRLQKMIESLMAGDPQGNVFAARGGRGGQAVAPFALLNLPPRNPGGANTPFVVSNPEVKIPDKGATPAKAVVFTIAAVITLAVVVWNILVIEKTWQAAKEVVGSQVTSPTVLPVPTVYRKNSMTVSGDWGPVISHDSSETIAIWGFDGLLFKSRRKGWVETPYTSGTKNLFGGSGSNDIQFRTTGGVEVVKYCIYPVGQNWRQVCQ
jgi:hypothetical protein